MSLVNENSLAATVDQLDEAFFCGRAVTVAERRQAAAFLAGRQGAQGAYRSTLIAPTARDYRAGARVFTGEPVDSRAGLACKLGLEAARVLALLKPQAAPARAALARVNAWTAGAARPTGMYCCGSCSVALWRHLATGPGPNAERSLATGLRVLRDRRGDSGRWRVFPFWYTLLALAELDLRPAVEEMRHAAPVVERYLRRAPGRGRYELRRREVARRVLARC